jgi:YegS/Rv2252/BmrU family lipid kinase
MQERRRITVIINPASGINRDAEATIRAFFDSHTDQFDAHIYLTQASGDATRLAAQGVREGSALVAAYGGDGTQMEAAVGLIGTDVPLLMLPGGTANVMAVDLGIPVTLDAALALALHPEPSIRLIDMGRIDNDYFLLRAGIGYEAEMSANAARGEKSKKGRWAYFENALRKLRDLQPSQYILTIDGETYVRRGITCMICNSSSIGVPNLRFAHNASVSDGLLDVIVIRNMQPGTILKTMYHIVRSFFPGEPGRGVHLDHWQGRQVTVQMKNRQFVARDGEPLKRSKRVSAHIVPGAVHIIVAAPPPAPMTDDTEAHHADPDRNPTPV